MIDKLSKVNGLSETGAKGMHIIQFRSGRGPLGWFFVLLALLFSAPSAHAATFLYTFTTTQLLSALSTSDTDYSADGYYAILLQPTALSGYSNLVPSQTTPDPTDGTADWQATTDSANPFGAGTWIEFAKGNTQTTVTLASGANGGTGGRNIFYYPGIGTDNTYSDSTYVGETGNVGPPIGFGNTVASITNIMAANDVFSFVLTDATNPGAVAFSGQAEAIWSSGSTATYNTPKTRTDISFSLTLTGTAVPEPDTLILFLTGAALVLAAGILRNKRRTASSGS